MSMFSIGAAILLVVMTYRRRNWARWVYSLTFVFGSLLQLPAQIREFSAAPAAIAALHLLVYAAAATSIALLFVRESSDWYSGKAQVLPNISLQADRER
jgi:hypothetical protein